MKRPALYLALCTGAFCVSTATPAAAHVPLDSVPGALPRTVAPLLYDINVVPDMKTMKIHGSETVTLRVMKPTSVIVVNALQTTVASARLDGQPARSVATGAQTLTMRFPRTIRPGTHRLAVVYTATLQTSPQGLFVQKYTDQQSGKPTQMLGSQMESTDARRMFPSWDEPIFRARFHLTATVPAAWTAVSNMPIERSTNVAPASKRVTFATSPAMPTYLVVLCAGEFDTLTGSAGATRLHVYGTRGTGPELTYALASLERLVPYFENYYGVKFPLPKLDLISIPQFFGGAMENWGGMTFTESTVVYNPALQSPDQQRRIFDIIAHETSHQWNGDLVTMAWWDSLWLNEGFATWMETKSTADLNPSWNWWLGFDDATNDSLVADARRNTTKIQVPVHNETEANTIFDPEIAYQKAGAFLRMMEAYLGPSTFQSGLHEYFVANAYSNSVPADLWSALSHASHQNVAALADPWIDQPGFPLVTVTSSCAGGKRTLNLLQHRYTSFEDDSATVWPIPLNVEDGSATTVPLLFAKQSGTAAGGNCDVPLIVNGDDLGYYRVAYDPADRALQQRTFKSLSVADRMSLLDDSWQFAVDGKAQLGDYLAYVKSDAGDTEPHVGMAVLGHFGSMLDYEYGQPGEAAFKSWGATYLRPLLAALGGWDGPTSDVEATNLRLHVLRDLAAVGDRDTIAEANRRYAAFQKDPNSLRPPLKDTVIRIVGRYADAATYQKLIQAALSSHNPIEMQTYFQAAFSAKDPALAQKSLQASLTLPPQFSSFAPIIVAIVGQDHPETAWAFLQKNDAKIFGGLSEFDRIPYVTGIAGSFWRGVPADAIEQYMKANVPPAASAQIAKSMEDVHLQLDHRTRLLPQIDAFVKAR
ncbi:MAG: M1 family metallopeptidase [Candidatus Eremiobacteraeota bacterium]|nr:M1 family metallopeptidase [Candidatus Eremiobacteraeota bacterium]MBC5802773.1 M1 family metallopeptidase [Candidatus Eremiobacteraeota bacterium]MBC5820892.1 M1 family metallopeptidase [Candidatus Eremiobacteraeota bacterium]